MKRVSYFALGVGLLTETLCAIGLSSMLVAQVTGAVPPSGVLITPPPAPVAVPPSGSLATVERNVATTSVPFRTQFLQTRPRIRLNTTRRYARRWRAHRRTTAPTSLAADQSQAATISLVEAVTEQPRTGYGLFFSQFGKGKE